MGFCEAFRRIAARRFSLIWFLLILIGVYALLNNFFLMSWFQRTTVSLNRDDFYLNRIPPEYKKQLAEIRDRIKKLELDLDHSNSNAKNLNGLIKDFDAKVDNQQIESPNNEQEPTKIDDKIGVLVFACNRPSAIEDHLTELIETRSKSRHSSLFQIVVSLDCAHTPTFQAVNKFAPHLHAVLKQPDQSDIIHDEKGKTIPSHLRGYFKIARHYKWALEEMFMKQQFQSVIITEDDLEISADFFDYFTAMRRIMKLDTSLFCVSAWNDNGKRELIDESRPDLVHRSDFFPGLGWMLARSFWLEIRKKWPKAYWDDWLREHAQRKGRACLRPEISRTQMSAKNAKNGVSNGQFFESHLKLIEMSAKKVDWLSMDNANLIKSNYDPWFKHLVYNSSIELSFEQIKKRIDSKVATSPGTTFLITYSTKDEFVNYANYFQIMNDFKCGVARTAYMGVVRIFYKSNEIFIAPKSKLAWTGYNNTM